MRAVNQCPWQTIPKIFQRFIYRMSVIYFMSCILLPFCIYFSFASSLHHHHHHLFRHTLSLLDLLFSNSYLFLAVCSFSSKVIFHTNDFLKISTTPAYLRIIWPLWVKANGRVTKFLLSDSMEIFYLCSQKFITYSVLSDSVQKELIWYSTLGNICSGIYMDCLWFVILLVLLYL